MLNDNIILEGKSPYGNISAYVEDDGYTIYFSLYGPTDVIPMGETAESWSPFRACWVCNKHPVDPSKEINMEEIMQSMQKGHNPIMPGQHCKNPSTPPEIDPLKFEIVWFQEGDCAALLHGEDIMAVIPAWCSPNFSNILGYAKEVTGPGFLGFKSLDEILPYISKRIESAKQFWNDWKDPNHWPNFLEKNIEELEKVLGPHTRYFMIDGEQWPPKGLLVFENDDTVTFVTVGVSILAQPRVELFLKDPAQVRRFELGMAFAKEIVEEVTLEKIGEFISQRVCIPWDQLCWFGEGHSFDCSILPPTADGAAIEAVVLTAAQLNAPQIQLPAYQGDPVNLLWAIPVTTQELNFLRDHSSDELFPLLKDKECSWIYKPRKGIYVSSH